MLNIVTGRSGSGKSTYVNQILFDQAKSGNNKLLLIVPEQFSFASERNILTSLPVTVAQNIEVLSFTRLSDYVGRSLGGISGTSADKGTELIIMLRALEGLTDSLSFYASHINSVSLAKELIKTINELKREGISPRILESASIHSRIPTLSLKLHELSLIYSAFDSLYENKFVSTTTITDNLIKVLEENNFFTGYTIVIDAFKGFTAQELEIIKHLISQADEVYISLCTEDIHSSDASMIWNSINDTAKKVIRIAKANGSSVKILGEEITGIKAGVRYTSSALAHIEKNIFLPAPTTWKPASENEKSGVTLYCATDIKNECNFVAATARKLLREENIRLKDIAVIAYNDSVYSRELKNAFMRFKLPHFEDTRQPVSNQPLSNLCKSVLNILATGFSTENLLGYLKTGLSPLDDLEIAELENYALMWGITGKAWSDDFTLNPGGMNAGTDEKSEEELERINELRKKIIVPLQKLKAETKSSNDKKVTAFDISTALYNFIIKTDVPKKLLSFATSLNEDDNEALALLQNRVYEVLMDCLNKLATIYGDIPTDIKTYYNLFCALVSVTDLGTIPHGLDEITIGSANRTRLSSPKVVFVVGCADGVFPPVAPSFGLLTANDRKNLVDLGIELSLENSLLASEDRFIAYSAVSSPREKLYVSYHRADGLIETLEPSIIYTNIKNLFKSEDISLLSAENLPLDYFAETEASTFSAFASNYISKTETSAAMGEALKECEGYRDRINTLSDASNKPPFGIADRSVATDLFGKNMYLSASKVDVYHKCPFEYYCKYGIGAKPREKAELNPRISGTVIHYVLENVIKEYGKKELLKMSQKQRNLAVDKWLAEYAEKEIGGLEDKTLRFKYLYNRLARILHHVLYRLCLELGESDFVPCDFELSIGNGAEIESYALELNDGGKLLISGSIDRVDKYEKDGKTYIRVVDYKSGGKDFILSDVLEGLNMQMLIYLFAIWAGGEERYGDVVPAGILYYPANRANIKMGTKSMDRAESLELLLKESRSNGLFLMNDDILEAMEHGKNGKYIKITDARGNILDTLITLENMALLKKKTDEILKAMAQDLHSGLIPAYPALGGNYERTCAYCDYSIVCRSAEMNGHEIEKLKNEDVYAILNGGENDE